MHKIYTNIIEIAGDVITVEAEGVGHNKIADYELDVLARGSPSSTFLNFAIFLLSIALSFHIALVSTTISANRIFSVFVIIVVLGYISGIVLFVLWFRNRQSTSKIIKRIKERIPPEATQLVKDKSKESN